MSYRQRPGDERTPPPGAEVLTEEQCLVEDGVTNCLDAERVALIFVVTRRWKVINRNLRVVHQPPAAALHREGHAKLVADLCPAAAQARVELNTLQRARPEGHVDSFERIDVAARTNAEVMVADTATEPADPPNDRSRLALEPTMLINPVAAAYAPDARIGHETPLDPLQPFSLRRGVIIGEGNDVGVGRAQTRVEGRNYA
jgi:hypothetical protein